MTTDEVEFKAVNTVWCNLLKDMKKNWMTAEAEHTPVMNLTDAIEGIQAVLTDKPQSELMQEAVPQATVQYAQQIMGMTDEAVEHFRKLAECIFCASATDRE